MVKADILVSVAAVIQNQAAIIPQFVADVVAILEQHYTNFEILLVDNGSFDETEKVVRQLLTRVACVRFIRLTRTTDYEIAVMAGLDAAIGDYVVTMDADLDPPSEVPAMVEKCRSGSELVLGVDKKPPRPGLLYPVLRKVFHYVSRRLVRLEPVVETTGYRAMSRQGVNALVKVRMRRRYFPVLIADVGLTPAVHTYQRISRSGAKPEVSLIRSIRVGLSVMVHNSIQPLRIASVLGLCGSFLSLLYSLYVVVIYLFKPDVMPGWTTLSLVMSGLFCLSFLMMALMGEYLGRVLEESTDRPLYHVRDELSSAVMLAEVNRKNVTNQSDGAS
jgi:polyisoprenyl-phosphate glycosyltransferase